MSSTEHLASGASNGFRKKQRNFKVVNTQEQVGIPGLPMLRYRIGHKIVSPHKVREFLGKMKSYTKANFCEGLHYIFDQENPGYPEIAEPENCEDPDDKIQFEKWKKEYSNYFEKTKTLKRDTLKLMGVMEMQMWEDSIDRVKQVATGVEAFAANDPLVLVRAIITTHLTLACRETL